MSNIKALGILRDWARHIGDNKHLGNLTDMGKQGLENICDVIESEVSECYMELPCDADGVPIHVGDCLQLGDTHGKVVALTYCPANGKLPWEWQCDTGDWYNTAFAYHYKPRTLEDVLKELANEVWEASCTCQTTWSDSGLDGIEERYADEIRELMGVDA